MKIGCSAEEKIALHLQDDFYDSGDDLAAAGDHFLDPAGRRLKSTELRCETQLKPGEERIIEGDGAGGVDKDVGCLRDEGLRAEGSCRVKAQ